MWRKTQVVVKEFYDLDDYQSFKREAEVHQKLRHPNVVMLIGICEDPACMVLELMHRGSLMDVLTSPKYVSQLDVPLLIRIAIDVARGMAYLHAKLILHRDLKSLNILLDVGWNAKV